MTKFVPAALAAVLLLSAAPLRPAVAAPAAAPAPLCSSDSIAGSILGTDGAAGTIYTKIALVNVSTRSCSVTPYPHLSFGSHGRFYRVGVTPAGSPHGNLTIAPGRSAILVVGWSDVDSATGPCTPVVDLYVGLPARGMPLWIPIEADACRSLQQVALTPGPSHVALPSAAQASKVYDSWFELQQCEGRLLWLSTHSHFSAPAHTDSLELDMPSATDFNTSEFVGMAFAAPRVAFDSSRALLAEYSPGGGSNATLCAQNSSIPYGIARMALGSAATKRGITIGTTLSQVQRVDGRAHVTDLGLGYAAIQYRWLANDNENILNVLFYQSKAYAIDYAVRPPR